MQRQRCRPGPSELWPEQGNTRGKSKERRIGVRVLWGEPWSWWSFISWHLHFPGEAERVVSMCLGAGGPCGCVSDVTQEVRKRDGPANRFVAKRGPWIRRGSWRREKGAGMKSLRVPSKRAAWGRGRNPGFLRLKKKLQVNSPNHVASSRLRRSTAKKSLRWKSLKKPMEKKGQQKRALRAGSLLWGQTCPFPPPLPVPTPYLSHSGWRLNLCGDRRQGEWAGHLGGQWRAETSNDIPFLQAGSCQPLTWLALEWSLKDWYIIKTEHISFWI